VSSASFEPDSSMLALATLGAVQEKAAAPSNMPWKTDPVLSVVRSDGARAVCRVSIVNPRRFERWSRDVEKDSACQEGERC